MILFINSTASCINHQDDFRLPQTIHQANFIPNTNALQTDELLSSLHNKYY